MDSMTSSYQDQRSFTSNQHGTHLITTQEHSSKSLDNSIDGMNIQMELITHPQQQLQHQQRKISSPSHHPISANIVQPKQLVVSSNNGPNGQNYHSSTISATQHPREQFPDLLNMQNTIKTSPLLHHTRKANQPLNPAALVLPPSPPLQFPHQFPHLIHPTGRSNATPHNSPANQSKRTPPPPPARSHSFENAFSSPPQETQIAPLLSPPAQFGQANFFDEKQEAAMHKGYATLPRKLQHSNVSSNSSSRAPNSFSDTKRGLVDWSIMTDRTAIYDGVGPRTSATGSSHNVEKFGNVEESGQSSSFPPNNISTAKSDLKQSNRPKCDCPDILEFSKYNSSQNQNKSQQQPPQRTSSLRRIENSNTVNIVANINPLKEVVRRGENSVQKYENQCVTHDPRRDSSGSDVTLGNESMSGYFEPFGKALPAPPPPAGSSFRANQTKNRDSIVSTDSDLDSILGMSSSNTRRQSCPLHKTHPMLQYNSSKNVPSKGGSHRHGIFPGNAEVKHLKGILKGGSMNKPSDVLKGAVSIATTKLPSITTNPVATAVSIQPSHQKTVIVTSSVYRDKSMSPISSSTTSSPSPPPLAPLIESSGIRSGNNVNGSKKLVPHAQKLQDNAIIKIVKVPSTTSTNHSGQLMNHKQTNSSQSKSNEPSAYTKTSQKVLSNSSSSSSFSIKDSISSTSTVTGSVYSKSSSGNVEALNV